MTPRTPGWGRWWRPPVDDEVRDELQFHVDMMVRDLTSQGMSEPEARREAVRRFGNTQATGTTCRALAHERDRRMTKAPTLEQFTQDVRFALRQLWRSPGFTATAVLTLALGVGATTAIFSVVHAVVLQPLPFPAPDRMVTIYTSSAALARSSVSVGNLVHVLEQVPAFESIAGVQYRNVTLADGPAAERVLGARVSERFFDVFPMAPLAGRVLTRADHESGRDDVVVLSEGLWARAFAGDAGIVGRHLRLDGRQRTVIGVMPARFDPTSSGEQLWTPAAYSATERATFDSHTLFVAGRVKPDVSEAQLRADLDQATSRAQAQAPLPNQGRSFVSESLQQNLLGDVPARLYVWLAAVGFVLLIACANVANLLLARAGSRRAELTVRTALGAGRGRVLRQLFTESLVLACCGAVAALGVAYGAIELLIQLEPGNIARLSEATLDPWALGITGVLAFLAAVLFGVGPAWVQTSNIPLGLAHANTRSVGGRHGARWRSWLIVGELAVSLVLLAGAGLMIRSALALERVDVGFAPDQLWTGRLTLPADPFGDPVRLRTSLEDVQAQVARLPGVAGAAFSSQVPMGAGGNSNGLLAEGKPLDMQYLVDTRLRIVTPGYLELLGVPLVEGRWLTEADRRGAEKALVLSASAARQLFPGTSAVGRRVACCEAGPDGTTPDYKVVVGVAGDIHWRGPGEPPAPEFYLPAAQVPDEAWSWIQRSLYLAVRFEGDSTAAALEIPRILRAALPGVPLFDVRTMDERLSRSQARLRFNTMLLTTLGVLGLVLVSVGVYGVTAHAVQQRTREIGLRLALGASRADVLRMIGSDAGRTIVAGLLLGAGGTAVLGRWFGSQLFQTSPTDPLAFAGACVVFALVAGLATAIPAMRATTIAPTITLRAD